MRIFLNRHRVFQPLWNINVDISLLIGYSWWIWGELNSQTSIMYILSWKLGKEEEFVGWNMYKSDELVS